MYYFVFYKYIYYGTIGEDTMRRLHLLHNHISANHLSQDTTMLVHKSYQMTSKKCIKKALLVATSFALLLSVVGCTEKENTDVTTEITTEYTTVAATEATTTTEEVIQAVEISFTATPETLESEEELIAFLTNREEEIKVILNDEAINELPLEVKTALKEQINFIWYDLALAGFTYSSLTNETKTKVLDIYSETKKLVEEKYPDYSSEYTIHFIKTNTDLQAQYQAILDAIEAENQATATEATTATNNKPTATTATNKPGKTTATTATNKPGKTTTAATTAAATTEAATTAAEDNYPMPNGNYAGYNIVYDANGNIVTYYEDDYYVYQYSADWGWSIVNKRDMSFINNENTDYASTKTLEYVM